MKTKILNITTELLVEILKSNQVIEFAINKGLPKDAKCVAIKIGIETAGVKETPIVGLVIESQEYPDVTPEQTPIMEAINAKKTNLLNALCAIADGSKNEKGIELILTPHEMQYIAQIAATDALTASGQMTGKEIIH
jgi:hypothetical protein